MRDWTEILLKPRDTLEFAIKVLQTGGARISLVVDSDTKLLGTVTDGDIRRALTKHIDMNDAIEKVMNYKPITICLGAAFVIFTPCFYKFYYHSQLC